MKQKYWVLIVWNDIEPELHGPYENEDERDSHAKELKKEHGNDHGIFPLDVNDEGLPEVGAYPAGFFMEEES
jgi:hypothetical protein